MSIRFRLPFSTLRFYLEQLNHKNQAQRQGEETKNAVKHTKSLRLKVIPGGPSGRTPGGQRARWQVDALVEIPLKGGLNLLESHERYEK